MVDDNDETESPTFPTTLIGQRGRLQIPLIAQYVVVSGGVLSGIGKGVTASSIGVLMKSLGLRVTD